MTSKELVNPIIKHFEKSSVGTGETFSDQWDSDDDYIIRHIFVLADGAKTSKSTITIRIDNKPITRDKVLAQIFGTNAEDALLLNIPLRKNARFEFELINNEGAAKDFVLELVLEKVSPPS